MSFIKQNDESGLHMVNLKYNYLTNKGNVNLIFEFLLLRAAAKTKQRIGTLNVNLFYIVVLQKKYICQLYFLELS